VNAWHWPQWVMLAIYAYGILKTTWSSAANKSYEPPKGVWLLIYYVLFVGVIYTLHVGGFW